MNPLHRVKRASEQAEVLPRIEASCPKTTGWQAADTRTIGLSHSFVVPTGVMSLGSTRRLPLPGFYSAAFLLLTILGSAALSITAHAQANSGSIVGTVSDPAEAVVPDAQVSLKNIGTDATQTETTSSSGTFGFVNLNPGFYSVTVSRAGFESFTQNASGRNPS